MKRLVLALATSATLLGTGCGPGPSCDKSVTVDWQFRNYANGVTTSCSSAGVDELDIYVNGGFVGTFPCGGPPATIGVTGASQNVRVDAIDFSNHLGLGANRIAYRDQFTVNSGACGDQGVLAEPAEGRVNLDYALPNGDAGPNCTSGCTLYYQVLDQLNRNAVAANYLDYAGVSYPNDILLRLPAGDYTVDYVQVVSNSSTLALRSSCDHPAFSVARPDAPGVTNPQLVPAAAPVTVKATCP